MTNLSEYGWKSGSGISLYNKIKDDLKRSMKSRDKEVTSALRMIMSEYPKLTVPIKLQSGKKTTRLKKPEEIMDDDILGILSGLVKSEKTVLEFKKEESSDYLTIVESYLPKMATEEEIRAWIDENIDFGTFKNAMQAMGPIMKHFGKSADGNMVKKLLQESAS